ncbi:MAG: hypothetical protein ACYC7F_01160 [Gemmatimonadaceae bacterium]
MPAHSTRSDLVQRTVAVSAAVFGLATIVAGGGVLAGRDPGYLVYRPLLLYNTAMGFAYLVGAWVIWRHVLRGLQVALVIAALNAAVLSWLMHLHRTSPLVATDSLRAMTVRLVVWLLLALALFGVARFRTAEDA